MVKLLMVKSLTIKKILSRGVGEIMKLASYNLWQSGSFPEPRFWDIPPTVAKLLRRGSTAKSNTGLVAIAAPNDGRYWEIIRLTKERENESSTNISGKVIALLGFPGNQGCLTLSDLEIQKPLAPVLPEHTKSHLTDMPIIAGGYRVCEQGLVPNEIFWKLPRSTANPVLGCIWHHQEQIRNGGVLAIAPDADGLLCPVLITELVTKKQITLRTQPVGMVNMLISYLNSFPLLPTWKFMRSLPSELMLTLQQQLALKLIANSTTDRGVQNDL